MPNIDFELYWATIAWPQQLQKDVDEAEKILVAGKVLHYVRGFQRNEDENSRFGHQWRLMTFVTGNV